MGTGARTPEELETLAVACPRPAADLTVEGELPPEVANDQSAWAG
jgi:hypothetical protein